MKFKHTQANTKPKILVLTALMSAVLGQLDLGFLQEKVFNDKGTPRRMYHVHL